MIGTAAVRTGGLAVAVIHALVAPLGADVVWEGLGIFGDVGADVVGTDAVVGKSVGVAVVGNGRHGLYTRLLEADERAGGLLVVTPCLSVAGGHTLGVNRVGVVLLGRVLGRRKTCNGEEGECDDGTHVGN